MKSSKPLIVTLAQVAKAAGVSKASASVALKNQPGVGAKTRAKIILTANRLGYSPDARVASVMASLRAAKSKDLLPIAWLNSHAERNAWKEFKFLTPYLEGAAIRASSLGYRMEEIWIHEPGMTIGRISKLLVNQGIEGVIITHPVRHIHLKWDRLASVSLGGAFLAPRLHRVAPDYAFNLMLALKEVKRHGYKRIGLCFGEDLDRNSARLSQTVAYYNYWTTPKAHRVKPLIHLWGTEKERAKGKLQVISWLQDQRPEVVIAHNSHIVDWIRGLGYRVPEDVGVVHTAIDNDVSSWTGIWSNRKEMGAIAAECVINSIRDRSFGLPKVPMNIAVRGTWNAGETLINKAG